MFFAFFFIFIFFYFFLCVHETGGDFLSSGVEFVHSGKKTGQSECSKLVDQC